MASFARWDGESRPTTHAQSLFATTNKCDKTMLVQEIRRGMMWHVFLCVLGWGGGGVLLGWGVVEAAGRGEGGGRTTSGKRRRKKNCYTVIQGRRKRLRCN